MNTLTVSTNLAESFGWKDQNFSLCIYDRSYQKIAVNEVVIMEADGNYTLFYFSNGKKLMVSRTLKAYEELLTRYSFVRIHKSYLINMHYLKEYDMTYQEEVVILKNGLRVGIARRRRKDFEVQAASFLRKSIR